MNIQSVTIQVKDNAQLEALLSFLNGGAPASSPKTKDAKATKGKPAKKEEADEYGEEETSDINVADLKTEASDDEYSDDEDFTDEAEEKVSEKQVAQLRSALNAHAAKKGKDNTKKIIAKFGGKADQVNAADFKKVMGLLKV